MDDSQEQLRKQQLKAALGMTASRQYSAIESEKMEQEAERGEKKAQAARKLKIDEKSVDKAKAETEKIVKQVAKGFTPLSPIDQQVIEEKTNVPTNKAEPSGDAEGATPASRPTDIPSQSTTPQPPSTRENQKQINRVNQNGEKVQPRLAEGNRVQPQKEQRGIPPLTAGSAVKKAAASALPIAAPLLSGGAAAALVAWIA